MTEIYLDTPSLGAAIEVYRQSMIDGYVCGNATRSTDEPWERKELFALCDWLVVDKWSTSSAGTSAGVTTVTFDLTPTIIMSYCGIYTHEAIPFLKKALRHGLERGVRLERNTAFIPDVSMGGRGPYEFHSDDWVYRNRWVPGGNFDRNDIGHGREEIRRAEKLLGWHEYRLLGCF